MKKAKKTIWDNIIIINSVLLVAMLLVNVFVIFLPNLSKNKNNPLLHYNYEVEFCSYVVTGENKQRVAKDNFFFNDQTIENNESSSFLNATLNEQNHVLIEYRVVNRAEDVPLKALVNFNNLTIENCKVEYSFSDVYTQLDSETLDLRIEPSSETICRIKVSIDNYARNAICEGKFNVVLSIAKGE